MAAADTARLIAELSLKDKMSAGLKTAAGNLTNFDKGVGRVGKGVGQMVGGLARVGAVATGVAATGLAGAAKAAIDWEDAFAGVVKTVDEADLAAAGMTFRDLELALREMATQMPNSAAELAGIAEQAGALGIKAADIQAFTKQVAILASTTNLTADEAATGLGQLQNVIGLTGDEFDNLAAALVDLGNKGASTESQILEIARRAGGAAQLFGIAKDETLGWAAAAANLGLNEELAGTALQNLFVKLMPKYSEGAKQLQKITGKTAKELKTAFAEDAGGAIEDLIVQLGKMPKDARLKAVQDLFGKGSGLTRLVLGLAESYETNLAPALETSTEAWEEATAAQIEFEKRNQTVRSAIARLKNGVVDAAISVGEGMAPAIGRAADELATFLRTAENRKALENIGKDVGAAIDAIDWKQVLDGARTFVDVMKGALTVAKSMWDIFNALPTQVKATVAALLAANKLSGGLLASGAGNILGGLGGGLLRNLGSKLPGVGKAFVQPVFVTNMPVGGIGGAGAAGAAGSAGGTLGKLLKVAVVGAVVVEGFSLWAQSIGNFVDENRTFKDQGLNAAEVAAIRYYRASAADQATMAKRLGRIPTREEYTSALAKLAKDIAEGRGTTDTLPGKGKDDQVLPTPKATKAAIDAATKVIAAGNTLVTKAVGNLDPKLDNVQMRVSEVTAMVNRTKDDTVAAQNRVRDAALETKRESARGTGVLASGQVRQTAGIVTGVGAAFARSRPIVNVDIDVSATTVRKTVTQQVRYGNSGTSINSGSNGSGTLGNGGR